MIVFNLYAIPVVIVIGIFYGLLDILAPKFMETGYGNLTVGLIAFVVGALSEAFGIKGRLFWLPIWLIGLGASGYFAWDIWGWTGAIAGAVTVVGGVVLLLFWSSHSSKKAWERAPDELRQARQALAMNDLETTFKHLEKAYVSPWGDFTREMCIHNLQLLDVLTPLIDSELSPLNAHRLQSIREAFEQGQQSNKETKLKDDNDTWLEELIAARGKVDDDPEYAKKLKKRLKKEAEEKS